VSGLRHQWWWEQTDYKPIDWSHSFDRFGAFLDRLERALRAVQEGHARSAAPTGEAAALVHPNVEAATLLGVSLDATPDQIRAALRAKMGEARVHPEHGGDPDLAKRLIAAKNRLIERAKVPS
jgi:hypothetical protein